MIPRVLVLQHDEEVSPGYLGEWMDARGIPSDVLMVRDADEPAPVNSYSAIATLGSIASVNDGDGWIRWETETLQRAIASDVPVLGLCFGGQSLAHAAGGNVERSPRSEIGLLTLETDDSGLIEQGPWFAWHHDHFTLPPGASEIARSAHCLHAFTLGPHLGLQFHPEADAALVAGWAEHSPGDLEAVGLEPDRVVSELAARADESRSLAFRLFDRFWRRSQG